MTQKIILHTQEHKNRAIAIIQALPLLPVIEVNIKEYKTTRNLEQNAKMWAMLTDISEQVNWHGNKLSKEEWKDVLTAALKSQKVVPGIDSGFVVIGAHTSKMSVADMAELIECAMAFGIQQGVSFKDIE